MNALYSLLSLLTLSLLTLPLPARAQTQLQTRDVATGLTVPWEIIWGPDNWIWMTERGGRVSRVNPVTGEVNPLVTIGDVTQVSESGLLGMALHPDFADTPHVFVVYTYGPSNNLREKLVRYTYNGTALTSPTILLQDIPANSTHDGSRLVILPDYTLLMTTGDAQNQPSAQSHTSLSGKVLRMNLDGSAPGDNPYAGAPSPADLIWTTGHRNAQGLVRASNGMLYSSEHGPSANDEVNLIQMGGNYGWPYVHGACDDGSAAEAQFCADSNVTEPLIHWTPTIAPAGIDYYDHDAIPEWRNSLLMVTLNNNGSDLRQLKLNDSGDEIIAENIYYNNSYGRLRDICIAPDGRVFISTSNRDGRGSPRQGDDRIIEIRAAASATITTGTITPAELRSGQMIAVPFTISGTFTAGNVFTAQLSDASGSFASPRTIGTLNGTDAGTISGTIPCDVPTGTAYRMRVVAGTPSVVGSDNGVDLAITSSAPLVEAGPDATICMGEAVQLSASGGTNYRWSPASGLSCTDCPDPQARPDRTTTYMVQATDELGCTGRDTVTVTVLPSPQPTISVDGLTLTASTATTYQWLLNGTPIDGAIGQTHTATTSGWYSVVVSIDGCPGISDSIQVTIAGAGWNAESTAAMRIYPDPVKSHLNIEMKGMKRGMVEIRIVDMSGKNVMSIDIPGSDGEFLHQLDVSQLPSGAYLLEVRSGEKNWREKFVR